MKLLLLLLLVLLPSAANRKTLRMRCLVRRVGEQKGTKFKQRLLLREDKAARGKRVAAAAAEEEPATEGNKPRGADGGGEEGNKAEGLGEEERVGGRGRGRARKGRRKEC